MFSKSFMALVASAAVVVAAPALAAPGGGGGPHGGMGAGAGANAHVNVNATNPMNSNTTINSQGTAALQNSQGLQHASPIGIAHANQNSVLARGAVSSTALPGLMTNMTVNDAGGTSIGTVSQIVTGSDGSIRLVIVTGTNGQTYRLAPSTLTIENGVVTTTSTTVP